LGSHKASLQASITTQAAVSTDSEMTLLVLLCLLSYAVTRLISLQKALSQSR
jgi:hypothetical protein